MKRWLLVCGVCWGMFSAAKAQELRCNISVSTQKIQGTNREMFTNMQKDMYEFVNNRRWSSNVFSYDERIEANIMITLDEQSGGDEFKGTMQVRVSRPVYNSSYNSVLLNFKDNDVSFKYREFEALEFNESGQNSELVNLLAFYAYIILGLDYDSFSLMGGNEFFNKAENIVAQCQNARETGWKSFEGRRNRYWLINNLQDRSYASVRECIYRYHRLGLDAMADNVNDGRLEIVNALELLQKAHRSKPNSYIMQVFFDAKSDEIVNIFKPAFTDERKRVYNIVSEVNPANVSKYSALLENKTN
ncbi:MAG: DUF4835 family protein [Oscillibacter sp.]|nr:DUF4835 family protein [Oscillibacter sp.]